MSGVFAKYPDEDLWRRYEEAVEVEVYGGDSGPSPEHAEKAEEILADLETHRKRIRRFLARAWGIERDIVVDCVHVGIAETVDEYVIAFGPTEGDAAFSYEAVFVDGEPQSVAAELG